MGRRVIAALVLVLGVAHAGERLAPEVSHDAGTPGGVVVLWPRVVPGGKPGVASAAGWQVQRALAALVRELAPAASTTVRPEPERVCPRAGCATVRVGALVVRERKACAVVALIGGPGPSPLTLVPWVGGVHLGAAEVPFREPPEGVVGVTDFVPCERMSGDLSAGIDAVRAAVAARLAVEGVPMGG